MEVVIFQMGKVASTALASALRGQGIEAVQAHVASPDRLSAKLKIIAAPYLSETVANTVYQDFHQELRAMYLLARRRVTAEKCEQPLLVISPTRDPLSWYWSHFAQMYVHYDDQLLRYFLDKGGRENDFQPEAVLLQMLEQMFSVLDSTAEPLDDPESLPRIQRAAMGCDSSGIVSAQINRFLLPLRWFDEDFCPAIGVDVYQHPFSATDGLVKIEVPGFSILLYRYEQLDELGQSLASFIGKPEFSVKKKNALEDKDIPANVREILQKGRSLIPDALVQRIYDSKYSQHFGYARP